MKKILFSVLTALILAGCGNSDDVMKCGEYEVKTELSSEDALTATLNGDQVVMKQDVSASGARYEGVLNDTTVVLWNKGRDWTLFLNDEILECKN
ncbi:MAG: MliC family protein [Rickettsiales bacterium]|nr:MliC family protein [Rickettsiales bacterium]